MPDMHAHNGRIALVTGGCFQSVAAHPQSVGTHRVVYIDASGEIDSMEQAWAVVPVDLGRGDTIQSLLAKFKAGGRSAGRVNSGVMGSHVKQLITLMGTTAERLDRGMAAVPSLGTLAWIDRLTPDINEALTEMVRELAVQTHGQMTELEIMAFHSNAGGTGRGISNLAINHIAGMFPNAAITVTHYIVGRMSYTCDAIPPLVQDNCALGTLEDICFHLRPTTPKMTVHRWIGTELPTVGIDKARRDSFAGLWAQAITAPETRDHMDRLLFTRRVTDTWGRFALVRTGWFDSQVEVDRIIRLAGERVQAEIQSILDDSGATVADLTVTVSLESSWDDVVGGLDGQLMAGQSAVRGWLDDKARVAKAQVRVARGNREIPQAELLAALPDNAGYKERAEHVRRLQALAKRIQQTKQMTTEARNNARTQLETGLPSVCPEGVLQTMLAQLKNAEEQRKAFGQKARVYYQTTAQEFALAAMLQAVESALDASSTPLQTLLKKLAELSGQLHVSSIEETLVELKPLDETYAELLRVVQLQDTERLKDRLWNTVKGFTLRGLASCLALDSDSQAAAIVHTLESLNFADVRTKRWMPGPAWGGAIPSRKRATRIAVLPPLTSEAYDDLKRAKTLAGASVELAEATSVAAGVGVVVLDVYQVFELWDLLPPNYKTDLLRALSDCAAVVRGHVPGAEIYLEGVASDLGMELDTEVARLLTDCCRDADPERVSGTGGRDDTER
jgi:hypothetical protein